LATHYKGASIAMKSLTRS